MIKILLLILFATFSRPRPQVYDVWCDPNLHLMMSDNGTPTDYSDDWVIDWEDNREILVHVLD